MKRGGELKVAPGFLVIAGWGWVMSFPLNNWIIGNQGTFFVESVAQTQFVCDVNRVPALVAAVLLVTGERMPDTIDSAFFYGRPQVRPDWGKKTAPLIEHDLIILTFSLCLLQIICTSVVLAFSIVLGGCSLVGLRRGTWDSMYHVLERDSMLGTIEDLRLPTDPDTQTIPDIRDMFEPAGTGSINIGIC